MKKRTYLGLILVLLLSSLYTQAQVSKAEIQVSGLTCSLCQLATQKAVRTLDFVADIQPDLNKNIFIITFKSGKTVKPDLLAKKVKGAGFSVSKLVLTYSFSKLKISNGTTFTYGGASFSFMNVSGQTLDGPTRITLLDKDFVSAGTYKKLAATADESYQTGKTNGTRNYHISL
ncbi:MAG: heavy-metal-associated domain-containing protein [Sphingobacteriaceae bacterium]